MTMHILVGESNITTFKIAASCSHTCGGIYDFFTHVPKVGNRHAIPQHWKTQLFVCYAAGIRVMQVVIPAWYSGDLAQEVMRTALSESSQSVPAIRLDDSCMCRLHVSKGKCRL